MSSLRDLVAGSDMCTPSDGAGPSNAVGALVNTLLGGTSKAQEQLRELPYVRPGLPGPSNYSQTPQDAARAATSSAAGLAIPGMAPPMLGLHQPPGFMHQAEQGMAPSGATLDEMEALFAEQQAQMRQQQAGILPPAGHPSAAAAAGLANGPAALGAMLHSFVGSARTQSAFQAGLHALPLGPSLSVADKVRIRDRATIMARHMFADMGQAAAEQQVGSLLASLAINPGELPAETNRHVQDVGWHDIWAGAAKAQHLPQPSVAADLAAAAAQAWSHGALPGPTAASGWAQECSDGLKAKAPQPSSWADEFAAAGPPAATSDSWAAEFGAATASAAVSASGRVVGADAGDARASSARVVQALGDDPKMARSQFFQFMSKMSKGELLLEDNRVVEVQGGTGVGGAAWAEEFGAAAGSAGASAAELGTRSWEAEWEAAALGPMQQQRKARARPPAADWADEFAGGLADSLDRQLQVGDESVSELEAAWGAAGGWADEFGAAAGGQEGQLEEWDRLYDGGHQAGAGDTAAAAPGEYVFAHPNPFLGDPQAEAQGRALFRSGVLSEAALALEAEVQARPDNAEAWRLLGTVQAENDDDRQAIAAMARALAASPGSSEVLLALGVSHTNELDQAQALSYLMRWLQTQPGLAEVAAAAVGPLQDSSQRLTHAVRSFQAAAKAAAGNQADVLLALGVLHHLGRQYDDAIACFRSALAARPSDYSLWNKLGATLANHGHSADALAAYQKALDLKPNYMRAWTNMGISYANVGDYEQSARYYVRALRLNEAAPHVWGYLRTSLACAGRADLLAMVDQQDLASLAAIYDDQPSAAAA